MRKINIKVANGNKKIGKEELTKKELEKFTGEKADEINIEEIACEGYYLLIDVLGIVLGIVAADEPGYKLVDFVNGHINTDGEELFAVSVSCIEQIINEQTKESEQKK